MRVFVFLLFPFFMFAHDFLKGYYQYYGVFTKTQLEQIDKNNDKFDEKFRYKKYYIYLEITDDRFNLGLVPYEITKDKSGRYLSSLTGADDSFYEVSGKILIENNETFLSVGYFGSSSDLAPFMEFDKKYKIKQKDDIYLILNGKQFRYR